VAEVAAEANDNVTLRITSSQPDAGGFSAVMTRNDVQVSFGSRSSTFSIPTPRETYAERVAAELRTLGRDAALIGAIQALASRFIS
jgi:hypothetical protein